MFAVQDGGQCVASATALQSFHNYGKSTACKADGEGGPSANQVYLKKGKTVKFEQLVQSFLLITFHFILFLMFRWCYVPLIVFH